MISAKQLQTILNKAFSADGVLTYAPPAFSLTATPSAYTSATVPGGINFGSTIVPYDNTNIQWQILDQDNNVLTTGSGLTVAGLDNTPPSIPGSYSYRLVVNYVDPEGHTAAPITVSRTVLVEAESYVGQLADANADITVSGLTNGVIQTLTAKTKNQVINYFTITVTGSARIILVIPNSYGNILRLEDDVQQDVVLSGQFVKLADNANNRTLFKSVNALSGSHTFKLVY